MTTKTSIADTGSVSQYLSDEAELARLANAMFRAVPGSDSIRFEPTAHGSQGTHAALRETTDLGAFSPSPVSVGGVGLSPSGLAPDSIPLGNTPIPDRSGIGVPGAGLPPSGFAGLGPEISHVSPSLGGIGLAPSDAPTIGTAPVESKGAPSQRPDSLASAKERPEHGGLYIVSESLARDATAAKTGHHVDWLTARPDLLPGVEDLFPVLASLKAEPAANTSSPKVEQNLSQLDAGGHPVFDVQAVRRDFPILSEKVHGHPLIWLDNGATTQKPKAVIERLAYFYEHENSNVHRGAHTLAARATDAYENARKTVARFLGASSSDEIVFVRGATEAINLVAQSWGRQNVSAGDEIIVSHLEHHANIVPWQQLAAEKGALLRVIPVDDRGQILLQEYERLLSDRTKIVAVTHVSNALGTVVPIDAIIARAHASGAKVLIDGAQSVAHSRVNMQALDADFFVFSGHKIFAPTGIGALYGKRDILNSMPPWQGGGNMIADVTFEKTEYQTAPARFEAGTGNLADAVGLGAALDYLEKIGIENIERHEHDLLGYATKELLGIPGLRIIGTAPEKVSVVSFLLDGFTPEEVGSALDQYGIAVRAGHHCAQPILRRFGVEGTVRASLALYNTHDDVDCLVRALRQISASRGR
jgi:cysteine desulfurase / selenocysteine lyase